MLFKIQHQQDNCDNITVHYKEVSGKLHATVTFSLGKENLYLFGKSPTSFIGQMLML